MPAIGSQGMPSQTSSPNPFKSPSICFTLHLSLQKAFEWLLAEPGSTPGQGGAGQQMPAIGSQGMASQTSSPNPFKSPSTCFTLHLSLQKAFEWVLAVPGSSPGRGGAGQQMPARAGPANTSSQNQFKSPSTCFTLHLSLQKVFVWVKE